jgi:uncharacterized protein YndB with AHSA1/START domain
MSQAAINTGAVELTRAISAPAQAVWRALTEREIVRRWRGELSAPLCPGELTNLDFGDGDFSVLEVIAVEPPRRLVYIQRLLGLGPKETITWQITPKGDGCLVSVTDAAQQRSAEAARVVRGGWLEQTRRLEQVLHTGAPEPPPWSREFSAYTELPGDTQAAWEHMIDPEAQAKWLPLVGALPADVGRYRLKDADEPAECELTDLAIDPQRCELSFRLAHADWLAPTRCALWLEPRSQGVLFAVRHTGWEAISFEQAEQQQQRRRFAKLWHMAMLYFSLGYVRRWAIPTLAPIDLAAQLDQPDLFIFDSNRVTLWEQGHIPSATFVGQEDIAPERLPAQKQATLVFYCRDAL